MSFFGPENSSRAEDNRIAVTDQGTAQRGHHNVHTEAGSVAVGDKSNYNAGLQLSDIKGGTITINDTAPISDALKTALSQQSDLVTNALDKVSTLSESKQTGGVSELNKTFLWVALGLFGLVAAIFYFRR